MSYVTCYGHCCCCGRLFGFNPVRVPSLTVNGSREPICQSCVDRANPIRKQNGLPLIQPRPDAYEACVEEEFDEGELDA
jgi:hypothetical protein